MIHARKF